MQSPHIVSALMVLGSTWLGYTVHGIGGAVAGSLACSILLIGIFYWAINRIITCPEWGGCTTPWLDALMNVFTVFDDYEETA